MTLMLRSMGRKMGQNLTDDGMRRDVCMLRSESSVFGCLKRLLNGWVKKSCSIVIRNGSSGVEVLLVDWQRKFEGKHRYSLSACPSPARPTAMSK